METKASLKRHNMELHHIKFSGHTLLWYKVWGAATNCPVCNSELEFK